MAQIKVNSVNTTHGNIEFEESNNPVISDFIQQLQQSREQSYCKYMAKESVVNKITLNVTTQIEQSPYYKRYYIIQAFKSGYWKDVIFSHGDISTAEKKARSYRNQNDCETRVIGVEENVSYSYEYEIFKVFCKNDKTKN